jgi:hypothetical protein
LKNEPGILAGLTLLAISIAYNYASIALRIYLPIIQGSKGHLQAVNGQISIFRDNPPPPYSPCYK